MQGMTRMIQQIATVEVYVDDHDRALEFWRDQVGFELRRRESMRSAGSWLEVAPARAGSRLVLYPRSMMSDWAEPKPSVVFECDDVQAAFEAMNARGDRFTEEPKQMGWDTYATFRDTDGNEFLLRGAG
jgi:predicted enzyme related to lactoylglutathione lyase